MSRMRCIIRNLNEIEMMHTEELILILDVFLEH